jgi:hypothetical protein
MVVGATGDACSSGTCGSGLICDIGCNPICATAGRCVAAPKPGESCVNVVECGPDAICVGVHDAQPGKCAPLGQEGAPCPCVEELTCVDGTCVPFGAAICP